MRKLRIMAPKVVIHTILAIVVATSLNMAVPVLTQADHDPKSTLDAFSGIGLDARREGGPLVRQYPLNHYKLDNNVDNGGFLDVDDDIEAGMHAMAGGIWTVTKFLTTGVISIFLWAFSFDLLENGLGGAGAASGALYSLVGREWMVAAIMLAGAWATWKGLVQRRYTETAKGLGLSVVFVVIALFFIFRPTETVSQISVATNDMSNALLSVATIGPEPPGGVGPRRPGSPLSTKAELSDILFRTFVYDPWVILNFGGIEHCVNSQNEPIARTIAHSDDVCIDHRRAYAPYWLKHAPGSDPRKAEYEALNAGEVPDIFADPQPLPGQFAGRQISHADEPAVDIQQEGMGVDRIGMASLVFIGNLGLVLLLGALALGIVLAQVVALLLVICAPVVLLVGIFPGKGHDLFLAWLRRLVEALLRKVIYSLIVALVLAMLLALSTATAIAGIPWGISYVLQAAFLWGVFLMRNKISQALQASPAGQHVRDRVGAVTNKYGLSGAAIVGGAGGAAWSHLRDRSQKKKDSRPPPSETGGEPGPPSGGPESNGNGAGPKPTSPSDAAASASERITVRQYGSTSAGSDAATTGHPTTDGHRGPSDISAHRSVTSNASTAHDGLPPHKREGRADITSDGAQTGTNPSTITGPSHTEPAERTRDERVREVGRDGRSDTESRDRSDGDRQPSPQELGNHARRRIEARSDMTTQPEIVPPEQAKRRWRWDRERDRDRDPFGNDRER